MYNVYIYLPKNDGEFEFNASLTARGGCAAYTSGLPENCYPAEDAEGEFENFGVFKDMVEAVTAAAWATNCPMSPEEIEEIAEQVEEETIAKFLEEPDYEDEY